MTGVILSSISDPSLEICEDKVNTTFFDQNKASISENLRKEIKLRCESKSEYHVEERKKENEDEDDEFDNESLDKIDGFVENENNKVGEYLIENDEKITSCCIESSDLDKKLSLHEFVQILPSMLSKCKENSVKKCLPIKSLMENLSMSDNEWGKYAFFDDKKLYTRNLVATDSENYTLLLLCWTPGRESMIHDHPTDGCWMRCVTGSVVETLYEESASEHKMVQKKETWVKKDEVCYIDDSMGYHKVGNPCPNTPAASLHLYSPPFQKCKVWPNGCEDSDNCFEPDICFYSIGGEKIQYDCNN